MKLKFKFRSIESLSDGHRTTERVQTIREQLVVAGDEAPLVLADVVHLARHVVVASDHVDLPLQAETLVRDSQLVHGLELLPRLGHCVEQVHFSVAVRVLPANQNNL